jgi:hypothetical protein
MSDVTPPPPNPEQPVTPPAAPVTPPAAPAAPAYAPAAATGPKQGLSLTSFILGLAGIVFSWAPFFGFLVSLAAVILGFLGKGREPQAPRWMWLVGIITGFVGLFIALIVLIFWIVVWVGAAASINNNYPGLYN